VYVSYNWTLFQVAMCWPCLPNKDNSDKRISSSSSSTDAFCQIMKQYLYAQVRAINKKLGHPIATHIYIIICSTTSTFFFGLTAAAANMLLMLDGFESGALMLGFLEALSFFRPLRPEENQNRVTICTSGDWKYPGRQSPEIKLRSSPRNVA